MLGLKSGRNLPPSDWVTVDKEIFCACFWCFSLLEWSKNKENLLTINDIDTGNHSSEAERNFSVNLNDGKADNEKEVRDLVSSVTCSSCVESLESSSVVEFPHFFIHRHPSAKVAVYMDKKFLECELQESKFCYKENISQDVKDICVDEGVPTRNQTLWEVDETKICSLLPETDPKMELTKDEVKSDAVLYALDLSSQEDSGKHATYLHQFENSVQMVATDTIVDDVGKKMVLTESKTELSELNEDDSSPSVDEDCKNEKKFAKISSESTIGCTSEKSKFDCEETVSGDPALPSTSDVSNTDNLVNGCNNMLDNRRATSQLRFSAPPSSGRDDIQQESEHKTENCQEGGERDCGSTQITSELAHRRYDSRDDAGYLQHGFGESSFTTVRTLSSLINHSGPVANSGSVSLRSDSSATTSTRSFAFPILQTEWTSSPVRMEKADRRPRKFRCWREGLLCCRF